MPHVFKPLSWQAEQVYIICLLPVTCMKIALKWAVFPQNYTSLGSSYLKWDAISCLGQHVLSCILSGHSVFPRMKGSSLQISRVKYSIGNDPNMKTMSDMMSLIITTLSTAIHYATLATSHILRQLKPLHSIHLHKGLEARVLLLARLDDL